MRSLAQFGFPLPATLTSAINCSAWPSVDRPALITLVTPGTLPILACSPSSAAASAAVSGPAVAAATTGIGCRLLVPNGLPSVAACELGALAGRNFWLLPWVTLDSVGSCVEAAIAPAIQINTTSQRNRTLNRPIAP